MLNGKPKINIQNDASPDDATDPQIQCILELSDDDLTEPTFNVGADEQDDATEPSIRRQVLTPPAPEQIRPRNVFVEWLSSNPCSQELEPTGIEGAASSLNNVAARRIVLHEICELLIADEDWVVDTQACLDKLCQLVSTYLQNAHICLSSGLFFIEEEICTLEEIRAILGRHCRNEESRQIWELIQTHKFRKKDRQ